MLLLKYGGNDFQGSSMQVLVTLMLLKMVGKKEQTKQVVIYS